MKLHEDKDVFLELIESTASSVGLPEIYVEKDYWVTKALKHLSESPYSSQAVFKGGTSLSKAYRLIDRFSEDIDLAIFSDGLSDGKTKTLLRNVEKSVISELKPVKNDSRESKGSKYRKTVYQYPRAIEGNDFGQASQELLIEVNAFTTPDPCEEMELQSLVADFLRKIKQNDLISAHDLNPFMLKVLSVRRTLIEKILAVIKYSDQENAVDILSNNIRHLYDICLIMREETIQKFLGTDEFKHLFHVCIQDDNSFSKEQSNHLGKPLSDAPLFSEFDRWMPALERTYSESFSELVHGKLPPMNEISGNIKIIYRNLEGIS